MSDYTTIARHPQTGEYEIAHWLDNYYKQHQYAVYFKSDDKYYPPSMVHAVQLKEFWAADVVQALREWKGFTDKDILEFLRTLNIVYKDRWKRDPAGGEGAVENLHAKRKTVVK